MGDAVAQPAARGLPSRGRLPGLLSAVLSAATWEATLHVAVGTVLGSVAVTALIPMVALSFSLLLFALAGLPLLWLTFGFCRLVALAEDARARTLLGERVRRRPLPDRSLPARMWSWTTSRGGWLELLYAGVVLPLLGILSGVVIFGAWGGGLAFLLFPTYGWAAADAEALFAWHTGYPVSAVVHVVGGALMLLAAPWLAQAASAAQLAAARMLLEPSEQEVLSGRVRTLETTRAGAVTAADAERRRIERDLHDGAQQRLVALAMTLGRAQVRFAEDPEAARQLVREAHGEAKLALAELRDLARGIHPAVLTDRGLDAALSALAARCPVPVELDAEVAPRAAPSIEAIAYFTVAEALTNVAKHSGARRARVWARRAGDRLAVEVSDDGRGGASVPGSSGLLGLRDRVLAVDGTFALSSPAGGPTTLRVELPCES